ncbi:MAG: sigma-70 family RNA polymerase sigma factor [Oscillospiraceae bacterium]|nr:sigma-70 family RNA polymerase sigma factor [Oscillospiraceae bacterium]
MSTERQERFECILREYGDSIYKIAWLHTKSEMDAQDIVQEVFLRYSKSEKNFESKEHIKAWLIRVTINRCNDLKRSQMKANATALNENTVDSHEYFGTESTLSLAVKKLPEKYRSVIHLFYYEGYSIKEIGKITNTTEGAVKMQLSRGRGLLKNILKGESEYAF